MLQADHDGGAVFTSDSCDTTRYTFYQDDTWPMITSSCDVFILANYSHLSRGHPKWWFRIRESPPKIPWTPLNSSLGMTGKICIDYFFFVITCHRFVVISNAMIPSSPGQCGGWRLHFWLHTSSLCSKADMEWAVFLGEGGGFANTRVDNMLLFWWFGLGFTWPESPLHSPCSGPGFGSFSHFSVGLKICCKPPQANRHVSVGWSESIPAVVVVFSGGRDSHPHWSTRRNFWRCHMVHFFVEPGS